MKKNNPIEKINNLFEKLDKITKITLPRIEVPDIVHIKPISIESNLKDFIDKIDEKDYHITSKETVQEVDKIKVKIKETTVFSGNNNFFTTKIVMSNDSEEEVGVVREETIQGKSKTIDECKETIVKTLDKIFH